MIDFTDKVLEDKHFSCVFKCDIFIHLGFVTVELQATLKGTFNPESMRVLSVKKCILKKWRSQTKEKNHLSTFLFFGCFFFGSSYGLIA